ncbi:MAG: proline iminopeptidase-family hydrolase [Saprospiraceae bacterium]|nr:proline iminopeptidase-family hydrolase [Saprospiraceae bacterium]MBK7435380.1 proline iminopeptidase-family hydrolase [Saprospiraceae bacterium]MBK7607646.1 proline iminopeptidase-family hydrolase [Saprospiraceae bacterium]MBK8510985.1 proline iminopeptidase-family hydrolase [Saprospiraceae bacterium]MBK8777902.1 proline iminopeptidase-family hydrolase [Saprospiraceae bacterium]
MKSLILSVISLVFYAACRNASVDPTVLTLAQYHQVSTPGVQSGGIRMIPIHTPKGDFKVWTKTIGHHPTIKVLLLHGGPGSTHEYWECAESFFPREGIEFILYDQLGSHYSDQPMDSSLWTNERFVEEVEQVRQALKLDENNFYLVGHSWGGILAMDYALKYQQHIKGLIISNMMSDCVAYDRYAADVLSKQMDPIVLDSIMLLESQGKYSDPRYMGLLLPHFYKKHLCRLDEWPDPVNRNFAHTNSQVYVLMQGPSEFGISGRLENWDRSKELKNINVPTLVIGATHDTMDPEHMKWMSTQFPNGRFLLCPNGSHMAMWDDQEVYFKGLISFLKEVDKG